MGSVPRLRRTAFVHIGMHKTGTTSLQELLTRNDRTLCRYGLLIPKACRIGRHSGHHNLAWELSGDKRFDPRHGTLQTLTAEIHRSHTPNVCISAEDLELLHDEPHALEMLRDVLLDSGYTPRIMLYLRPQADYIESAYAEIVKLRDLDFRHFLESVLADRRYENLLFTYDVLADRFTDVFGPANMIVRAYESHRPSAFLLNTFLTMVAPGIPSGTRLTLPGRLNPMASCSFDPLTAVDLSRIEAAFRHANQRLRSRYAVEVTHATPAITARASALTTVSPRYAITARGSLATAERPANGLKDHNFTVQTATGQ